MNGLDSETNERRQSDTKDLFEEIEIPVPWGHIAAKWWGPKSVQPIIAIHGWQDNCGTFDTLAPLLTERGLSLLCIDLPGHGFSSHLPQGVKYYVWWDGIHYVRRIVKHFNWTNITLMGHSLGGGISFLYASTFPDEVNKYVSIDIASPSVRTTEKMCNLMGDSIDKFLSYENLSVHAMPCYGYDEMVQILEKSHIGELTTESCKILLRRGMRPATHKEGYLFTRDPRLKVAALGFFTMDQVLPLASRIKCEVLNIQAKSGIKLDNPEYYGMVLDVIEKSAKKLERHVVEGSHHLHLNDPYSVVDIIYRFLVT